MKRGMINEGFARIRSRGVTLGGPTARGARRQFAQKTGAGQPADMPQRSPPSLCHTSSKGHPSLGAPVPNRPSGQPAAAAPTVRPRCIEDGGEGGREGWGSSLRQVHARGAPVFHPHGPKGQDCPRRARRSWLGLARRAAPTSAGGPGQGEGPPS